MCKPHPVELRDRPVRLVEQGRAKTAAAVLFDHVRPIDATSLKTSIAKTIGPTPRGQRLADRAPSGHWRTQTFIGALRHDRLDAPWVIGGAMNGEMSDLSVETPPAPTQRPCDVVILDNVSSQKNPGAAKAMREIGAWFLFPPPCSPDHKPIERALSRLKALIRKATA